MADWVEFNGEDRQVGRETIAAVLSALGHDTDTPGFARMMNAIFDGRPFVEAVDTGYRQTVQSLWRQFARQ